MRAHAVAPLRRCAVLGVLRYPDVRMRRCAVAPLRRAAVLDLLRCHGAHMRRCAVAPLRRCLVLGLRCNWSRRLRSAAMQLRPVQRSNGATEQRSGVALLRHGRSGTEQRSAEQRSGVAPLRHGAPARRFGAEQRSTEQRRGAAPLRPKRKEHGARSGASEYGAKQFRGRMFHPQWDILFETLEHQRTFTLITFPACEHFLYANKQLS